MNEMRRDPISRRWIIIDKSEEPDAVLRKLRKSVGKDRREKSENCAFCPGNEDNTPLTILEFMDGKFHYQAHLPEWQIRVVPNRNPVFRVEGNLNRRNVGNYDVMDALGAHEVIIETRSHSDWDELSREEVSNILRVYYERVIDLSRDERFGHVMIFKNYGAASHSKMPHPHSTLIASPSVPERIRRELEFTRMHYQMKERCIFCDIINEESRRVHQSGLVKEYNHFITISPFFAAHPFETWILPRKHNSNFRNLDSQTITELATALRENLAMVKNLVGQLSYSLLLFSRPNKFWGVERDYWSTLDLDYHWHFKFIPRFSRQPGFHRSFSAGSGYMINQIPPEVGAALLRDQPSTMRVRPSTAKV